MSEASRSPTLRVLSHVTLREVFAARARGAARAPLSLDLGLSSTEVELEGGGVVFEDGTRLDWHGLAHVIEHENVCFELRSSQRDASELVPIRGYSEARGRSYQLMPTESAPALMIAGFLMHRVRDVSPVEGARAMVKSVLPVRARVLDTATGLGYAAVEAALHASEVVTIEIDPMATEIASKNPWSSALFDAPNISRRFGDSAELIASFEPGAFEAIVHDPPAINLAGELYSERFYADALRVLARGGRMFHYVGDPHSKSGATVSKGVARRLAQAGFRKIVPKPEAFGFLAVK